MPIVDVSEKQQEASVSALQEIEQKAMHLEDSERALLAEHLIASLERGEDVDAEKLWVKEAEARYAEYKKGKLSSSPSDEVMQRARRNLK